MSALGSSEASSPQRFNISIKGSSNGATQLSALGAVSSLGGPFSEVPLYSKRHGQFSHMRIGTCAQG